MFYSELIANLKCVRMAYGTLVQPSPGFTASEHSAQFWYHSTFFYVFSPKPFAFLKSKDIHLQNHSIIKSAS